MKVLGGVHGAGRRARGTGTQPAAAGARARPAAPALRWQPALAAAAVVVVAGRPGPSRGSPAAPTCVEESPDGNVQVAHGLPFDVAGLDLVLAVAGDRRLGRRRAGVRPRRPVVGRPGPGRGREPGGRAGVALRPAPRRPPCGRPAPDTAPERAPAPATPEPGARVISPRTRELGFLIPAGLLGLVGMASVASARADELRPGPDPRRPRRARGLPRDARRAAPARAAWPTPTCCPPSGCSRRSASSSSTASARSSPPTRRCGWRWAARPSSACCSPCPTTGCSSATAT